MVAEAQAMMAPEEDGELKFDSQKRKNIINVDVVVVASNSLSPRQLLSETSDEIAAVAQSESKWKRLDELAMSSGLLEMAEDCLKQENDLSSLLLLYSSLGDAEGITELASLAKEHGKNNVAFLSSIVNTVKFNNPKSVILFPPSSPPLVADTAS